MAWFVRQGNETRISVDAEPGPTMSFVTEPMFTSAAHLVYAGGSPEKGTVYVDHREGPWAEAVLFPISPPASTALDLNASRDPFRVSPDGTHVAWGGVFLDGACPVLDDRVGPRYDQVLSWSFGPDGVATWWVQRGQVLYRVRTSPVT